MSTNKVKINIEASLKNIEENVETIVDIRKDRDRLLRKVALKALEHLVKNKNQLKHG